MNLKEIGWKSAGLTGLTWISGRLLCIWYWTFRSHKRWETNCFVKQLLASQTVCSLELTWLVHWNLLNCMTWKAVVLQNNCLKTYCSSIYTCTSAHKDTNCSTVISSCTCCSPFEHLSTNFIMSFPFYLISQFINFPARSVALVPSWHAFNQRCPHGGCYGRRLSFIQLEDTLYHRQFSWCCVHATEGAPIIHHHTCSNHLGTPVNCACHKRYLKQWGQLILVLNGCMWVHKPTLVWEDAIRTNQNIWCNCLAEHFNLENISQDSSVSLSKSGCTSAT